MLHYKYFRHILVAGLLALSLQAHAQYASDFEKVAGRDDKEIVYKGTVTFDDVESVPAFLLSEASESYKPNAGAIKNLTGTLKDYDLVVFLGTWCEDSHRMIPQLFRVLNDVAYPLDKLTLNAVDRDKKGKGNVAEENEITLVPTIIVMQAGREIGRITEITDKSVEQDLWKIIHP